MNFTKYISWKFILIGFILGCLYSYFQSKDDNSVIVYPSLDNYKDIIYKDDIGNSFMLSPYEINCNNTNNTHT